MYWGKIAHLWWCGGGRARMHADKGMGVAVTETARQRLLELEEEPENKLPSVEDAVAGLEVARVQKEETGARPVCVLGAYGQVSPLVRHLLPSLAVLKYCFVDASMQLLSSRPRFLVYV